MVVRLRLQRFGRTHSPFYRMVAADSRAPRDGKFIEIVSCRMWVVIIVRFMMRNFGVDSTACDAYDSPISRSTMMSYSLL